MYLLDTNICIYLIKKRPEKTLHRLLEKSPEDVALSVVTAAELQYGVAKSAFPQKNQQALQMFLAPFSILSFDAQAAYEFGRIRALLEKRGPPIGIFDMMIAAHALSEDHTLVTNNEREFRRVEGLVIENWVA